MNSPKMQILSKNIVSTLGNRNISGNYFETLQLGTLEKGSLKKESFEYGTLSGSPRNIAEEYFDILNFVVSCISFVFQCIL